MAEATEHPNCRAPFARPRYAAAVMPETGEVHDRELPCPDGGENGLSAQLGQPGPVRIGGPETVACFAGTLAWCMDRAVVLKGRVT